MDTVEVGGLRIGYERRGAGPPLVLVHGYVGDGRATWRPQLDDLSDQFTVIAWDAPGVGSSSDPSELFGISGYADCLAGFIDALGVSSAHITGLSFGGALAIELCHRHPSVVSSLVLVSAYAGWRGSLPTEVAEQRLQQALALSELSAEEFVATLLPTMFAEGTDQRLVDAFGSSMGEFHPAGFRAIARASAEDLRLALSRIRVPTLLVYGDNDVRAPMPVAEQLHTAIDGSSLVVLAGAGHVCNIERPDKFNAAVRAFLHDSPSSYDGEAR